MAQRSCHGRPPRIGAVRLGAPVASRPAGLAAASSPGACNQTLQAKLTVGRQDDPLEREADRAADRVLAGGNVGALGTADPGAQRKCAACESEEAETVRRQPIEEEEEELQAKAETGGVLSGGAEAAASAVATGGRPLSAAERGYYEPRFGRDFSTVRLHGDSRAASAAAAINARAFTLGNHIAFTVGAYAPKRRDGRRLLAHELAHVAQQDRAPTSRAQSIRREPEVDTSGGGKTAFEEKVPKGPKMEGSEWVGDVKRREFVPAKGEEAEKPVSSGTVRVHFDPTACKIRLPYRLAFRERQTATGAEYCKGPPAPPAKAKKLSGDAMDKIGKQYKEALNSSLNGWYTAILTDCEHNCAGQSLSIKVEVEVTTDESDSDSTIDVVNRGGRGNSGTICVPDYDPGFAAHEGGHQVLGHGDEYIEKNKALRKQNPEWAQDERERPGDWSIMNSSEQFGRFALLHERHFAFVPAFLEAALGGCSASLEEIRRPIIPDFRLSLGVGYATSGGGHGYSFGGGFDVGLPLDRQRDWQLLLGVHSRILATLTEPQRSAWMVGARVGLERNFSPSSGGARIGAFAELGGGSFGQGQLYDRSGTYGSAYGEAGLQFGYRSAFKTSAVFVGAEVAGGAAFQSGRGTIGEPGMEIERPESFRWLRAGLSAGLLF